MVHSYSLQRFLSRDSAPCAEDYKSSAVAVSRSQKGLILHYVATDYARQVHVSWRETYVIASLAALVFQSSIRSNKSFGGR